MIHTAYYMKNKHQIEELEKMIKTWEDPISDKAKSVNPKFCRGYVTALKEFLGEKPDRRNKKQ